MARSEPLDIRMAGLLKAVIPLMLVVAGLGSLPMWRLMGTTGVLAEFVAVCGVMGVMVLNAKLTVLAAKLGSRDACIVFLGGSVARVLACPALVFLIGWLMKLPVMPLSVWLAITYLVCLMVECAWIVVALKRHVKLHKPQKSPQSLQPQYMDWSI